jgi:hypothetical protein
MLALWLSLSGFTLSPSIIDTDEIISGGPPKDGIPALTNPKRETVKGANRWLEEHDQVLGIVINGKARAYPIRILNWHEIVNDRIDKIPVVITYCPLCGSGIAFHSKDKFGVSGLLYQSDVLLYDRKSESVWSQIMMQAVAGPRAGERLIPVPIQHTSWKSWRTQHPKTTVLSRRTGHWRDYDRNPYLGYNEISDIYFPIRHHDTRLHPKTWVIGLELGDKHKAWEVDRLIVKGSHLHRWQKKELFIEVKGENIRFIDRTSGVELPAIRLYWFAWATFHPDTELEQ